LFPDCFAIYDFIWTGATVKMSFIPGRLELASRDGMFAVSVEGTEVFRSRSQRMAVAKFKELRSGMEQRFPPTAPSAEDSKLFLQRLMTDVAVDETLRRPAKKRSTARSSRTFGG
jgi:hypothetical protein